MLLLIQEVVVNGRFRKCFIFEKFLNYAQVVHYDTFMIHSSWNCLCMLVVDRTDTPNDLFH